MNHFWAVLKVFAPLSVEFHLQTMCGGGNVCPARARRATFLLTILTSARDLPSDGEGPQNRP